MNEPEKLAYRHLFGTMKAAKGRSDCAAQEEAERTKSYLRGLLSSDPNVIELARDGMEAFMERTATRILAEHANEVFLNIVPSAVLWRKLQKRGNVASAFMIGTKPRTSEQIAIADC